MQTLKQRIQSTIIEVERIVAGKHNDNPGTVTLKNAIAVLRECLPLAAERRGALIAEWTVEPRDFPDPVQLAPVVASTSEFAPEVTTNREPAIPPPAVKGFTKRKRKGAQ